MTDQEIIEGNKLIAEFDEPGWYKYTDKGWLKECKYPSSWGWLMPVVEKIESLNNSSERNEVDIFGNCCDIGGVIESVAATKIEATYTAVVAFIKIYNNKSNT